MLGGAGFQGVSAMPSIVACAVRLDLPGVITAAPRRFGTFLTARAYG